MKLVLIDSSDSSMSGRDRRRNEDRTDRRELRCYYYTRVVANMDRDLYSGGRALLGKKYFVER